MVKYNIALEGTTVLVTGAAGFIGSNLVKRLFHDVQRIKVIGIDSITDYYDVRIKHERLKEIEALNRDWTFVHASIADKKAVEKVFAEHHISVVVNLAAQAGVRYSITNPDAYIESNLIGFTTYSKPAATTRWNTLFMPHHHRCMAATKRCLTPPTTRWTTR